MSRETWKQIILWDKVGSTNGVVIQPVHRWGEVFMSVSPLDRMSGSAGDKNLKLKALALAFELHLAYSTETGNRP